jgi:hypothetical protein
LLELLPLQTAAIEYQQVSQNFGTAFVTGLAEPRVLIRQHLNSSCQIRELVMIETIFLLSLIMGRISGYLMMSNKKNINTINSITIIIFQNLE